MFEPSDELRLGLEPPHEVGIIGPFARTTFIATSR